MNIPHVVSWSQSFLQSNAKTKNGTQDHGTSWRYTSSIKLVGLVHITYYFSYPSMIFIHRTCDQEHEDEPGTRRGSRASEQSNSGFSELTLWHTQKHQKTMSFPRKPCKPYPNKSPVEQRNGWSTSGIRGTFRLIPSVDIKKMQKLATIATTLW